MLNWLIASGVCFGLFAGGLLLTIPKSSRSKS
jgi:hypothetical protein